MHRFAALLWLGSILAACSDVSSEQGGGAGGSTADASSSGGGDSGPGPGDAGDATVCGKEGGPGAHELECFCSKFPCPSSANDDFCTQPFTPCVAERFVHDACQRIRVKQDTSIGRFEWLFDSTTGKLVGAWHATDTSQHGPSGETLPESCVESDCELLCQPTPCSFATVTCNKDAG